MGLLLDTHVVLWWLKNYPALPSKIRQTIQDAGPVLVSAASAWEIATKFHLGKLPVHPRLVHEFASAIAEHAFMPLAVSMPHALKAGSLPYHHRDPFDRMIIAQAMGENLTLVSADRVFANYDVRLLWE